MAGPLQGVKVFDLTVAAVGPFATMILANMGANVVKVEEGPVWPPARQGSPPTYRGLTVVYMACQLGKRGIYLDLKTPEGKEAGLRLLQEADVFVENMKFGSAQRLGLGYEEISKVNPHIIYGNFPGWGSTGPYADRGCGDPTAQVFSGSVSITGPRGGEPELNRWHGLHDFNAGLYIVVDVLLGLLHRERTRKGLRMLSPQVGASVAVQTSRIAEFLATGENVPRMGSATTTTVPHRAFQCQDKKWLAVGVITDTQWRSLCRAIGASDLLEDRRFATNPGRVTHRQEVEGKLGVIFATKPTRWWLIQLRKNKVPVSLFYDYETIPNLPQVKANNIFIPLKYPGIGTLPFVNIPFQYSKTPIQVRPGPWPGEHTQQVLEEGFGQDGAAEAKGYFGPTKPIEKGILDGVTVIDMTQGISGPYASLLLADSGARVIKVEPPQGDYARHFGPPMVDGVSATFFHLNRNKEGIRLDIRRAKDRERLLELLQSAEVFIEEEGQPRLKRWGLSYQDLEKLNPRLICCTITPFGTRGPLRNQPASELVLQAMSDFLNMLGVPGQEPVRMGPDMASAGTSLYVVQAILGALYHQWRTGQGQHITVSQLGTLLHEFAFSWAAMVNPDEWTGLLLGYTKPPEHAYKTGDQSIFMSRIRDPDQFPDLLQALGMGQYLEHPLFRNPPDKIMGFTFGGTSDFGELPYQAKPIWEQVFKKWKAEDLLTVLNRFGSSSAVVNNYQQLYSHPQIKAMGLFKEVDDPKLGKIRYLCPPWKLYGVPTVAPQPYAEVKEPGCS